MADSYEIGTGHISIETRYDGRSVRRTSFRAGQSAGNSFSRGFFGYGQMGQARRFRKMVDQFFKPIRRMQAMLNKIRRPALFAGLGASLLALIPTLTQVTSAIGAGAVPATLAWYSSVFLVRGLLGALNKSIKNQTLKLMNDLSGELKEVARNAAAPGLNAFIEEALKHAPILNRYVRALATYAGHVAFSFRDLLQNERNIWKIRTTLDGTARATGMWYSLLDEAAEVILTIAAAGTPLFERFTRSMVRVGHTIHDWVMLQEATGALRRHLLASYETLEKIGRGGRDFLIGLFNIVNGGVFGSEKVADNFERWGAAFREWSTHTENIEKVRNVIKWFTDHIGHFFRLAAAATAVGLALKSIQGIEGLIFSLRTMLSLGPVAFILFGIGAAIASLAGGMVLAYTHSKRFQEKIHDLFTEIKERLGPIIGDWIDWVKEDLAPLLEKLATEGLDKLSESLSSLMDTIEDNKEGLKGLRYFIEAFAIATSYLTGFVLRSLIEELRGVITILGWLGRAANWLETAQDKIIEWAKSVADWFVKTFDTVKEKAGDVVHNVAKTFRELPEKITSFLKGLPGALINSLNAALDGLLFAIGFGLGKAVDFFVRLPGRIVAGLNAGWDFLYDAVSTAIGKIVDFFARLPGRVMDWFDRTWDSAYKTTTEWFDKIKTFVSELPGKLVNALVDLLPRTKKRFSEAWDGAQKESGNKVTSFMTWAGKIPGRAWAALVRLKNRIVDRFAEGWAAATGTSKTKVTAIINFILGIPGRAFRALAKLAGQLKSRASSAWQAFRDEAGRKVAAFITFVSQIPGRVVRGLGSIGTKLVNSGRSLIQGLLDGVKAKIRDIGGLGGWFKANLVDPVVKAVKHFFDIRSPSRVFQGIGQMLVAGLWKGIASKNPTKMIGKIFGSMPKALVAMVKKGVINLADLPQKALQKLGGFFDDLFGGGGGSAGGLVGFARLAWDVLSKAFGLPMGGWRATGSVPGSDHPKGKAIDIMTTNGMLHRLIIELGKRLPGAKYWISMRKIAFASEGWKPRPYNGPSPHTDHVHWSFYRQGGRLPADVTGFDKFGRGYQFHRGEDVIRRNQTTIAHQGAVNHYHFQPGSVVLDASSVKDLRDIVTLIQGLQTTARMYGASATTRVT